MGFVRGRIGGKANVAVDTEGLLSGERRLDESLIRNVSSEKGPPRSDWMGRIGNRDVRGLWVAIRGLFRPSQSSRGLVSRRRSQSLSSIADNLRHALPSVVSIRLLQVTRSSPVLVSLSLLLSPSIPPS